MVEQAASNLVAWGPTEATKDLYLYFSKDDWMDEDVAGIYLNSVGDASGGAKLLYVDILGSQMRVTMASGVSITEANGQSSVAVQGHQVTVPLNLTGQVSGPPAQAVALDPLLEYILGDLLTPLTEEGWQRLVSSVLPRLNRAIDRCLAGQPAYVYNLLFWTRVIESDDDIRSRLDPAQLAQAYDRAPRCLTFEVDFDSSVTTTTPGGLS